MGKYRPTNTRLGLSLRGVQGILCPTIECLPDQPQGVFLYVEDVPRRAAQPGESADQIPRKTILHIVRYYMINGEIYMAYRHIPGARPIFDDIRIPIENAAEIGQKIIEIAGGPRIDRGKEDLKRKLALMGIR